MPDAIALADAIRRGETTAEAELEAAISRCESLNPRLNAIVCKLYDEARASLANLPDGPFRGVPFLLKDLLSPLAGAPLSQGCKALRHFRPDHDSELVKRFKSAGLVIFGKTSTPEFGLVGYTEPEAFGPCRNPWNLDRSVGGSSGGSAAAVAAGIVPIAHGGDGGGSIRLPAANCGVFGLKPSRGRLPTGPDYGEVWSGAVVEHALTRSVRDSAALLDWLAAPDAGAPYLIAPPPTSFSEAARTRPRALRVGVILEHPEGRRLHPDCHAAVEATVDLLRELGHQPEPVPLPYDYALMVDSYLQMYYGEVAADLRELAGVLGRPARREDVELATWVLGKLGHRRRAADFAAARRHWNTLARSMGRFHQQYDLLLTPTLAEPPTRIGELQPTAKEKLGLEWLSRLGLVALLDHPIHQQAIRNFARMPFTQIANLTGQPAMSIPLYWSADGLPIGSHFIAPNGDEVTLFQLAGQLESVAPWAGNWPPVHA
ncbi:amidase [Parachitinimonas caeni]|uniref:Amidase family protein n=1 Tax=Parachitinimonas caeni TaxID=3031301 RepID=A0ABT7DXS2_9NEIS|nr:amidase family protein [Parachitinimonas caeni]MDK2124835.1 amidase family protein [Parachitinimonas caeni]